MHSRSETHIKRAGITFMRFNTILFTMSDIIIYRDMEILTQLCYGFPFIADKRVVREIKDSPI